MSTSTPAIAREPGAPVVDVVIKCGGAAIESGGTEHELVGAIAEAVASGIRCVVLHGGGPETTALAGRLGIESRFVAGQRVTDAAMLEAATMTLAGSINKRLVRALCDAGVPAVGLSGVDGSLIRAEITDRTRALGLVGEPSGVNGSLLDLLLSAGYLPVVAPVAFGEGTILNVNADLAAAAVAGALGAGSLIYVTDVPGIMVDGAVVERMTPEEATALIDGGIVTGGMIPKVRTALDALRKGAGRVRIVQGRAESLRRGLAGEPVGTAIELGDGSARAGASQDLHLVEEQG